jgi:hypothetical protein
MMPKMDWGNARLKREILQYVRSQGECTFPDLEGQLVVAGYDPYGDIAAQDTEHENLYVWAGMSMEFAAAIHALVCEKLILQKPLPYSLHRCLTNVKLRLPVAYERRDYDEPHWIPVTLVARDDNAQMESTHAEQEAQQWRIGSR